MEWTVAALPGDGIGPEVTAAAVRVLDEIARRSGAGLHLEEHLVGWAAVQATGSPLPEATRRACLDADAVFLGAVGDPAADGETPERRPERGLLDLRADLGCWANLRPVRVPDALVEMSPLKPDRVRGTDVLIVRELGGGLYYGEPRADEGGTAVNTLRYSRDEVARIARLAFSLAEGRGRRVTSVDKANVLEVSRLWRRVVDEEWAARAEEAKIPIQLSHMLVDRAAMELVLAPAALDVVLTDNLFGDILSDEAGAISGSLGLLGSASLGGVTDLYEPVHGSAPDIAGEGIANPVGALRSVSMMLRYTFERPDEADRLDGSVDLVLESGARTRDVAGEHTPVATAEFTDRVLETWQVAHG